MGNFKELKYPDPVLIGFGSPGTKIFGDLVAKHRKLKKRKQQEVAEAVGCSGSMISMVEAGKRAPTRDLAEQILATVTGKLYYRIGGESDNFDICLMDPFEETWRFFNFETEVRKDSKQEYEEKFDLLRSHEKYKVLGYIDALIAERGE